MYEALVQRIGELEQDASVRVVVLRGAPGTRFFSAGADIKEFDEWFNRGEGHKFFRLMHSINNRVERLPQITIAAMEGPALGGGAELALAFDLRVATPLVRFGFPEIQIGQVPGTGGTLRLPWLIGESAARGILLTGDPITADRAYQLGLFDLVVQPGQAVKVALDWAAQLAERPAQSVLAIKRSVLLNRDRDVEKGTERDSQFSEWVFQSDDAKEGHYAFLEKRQPQYSHKIAPMQEVPT